jgi:hypothetical protein
MALRCSAPTRWSTKSGNHQVEPNNLDAISFAGFDFLGGGFRNNAATIFVTQKHWDERKVPVQALVGELFMKTAGVKEALVLAFNPPPIFGLGNAGGFEFYIQNRGDGGSASCPRSRRSSRRRWRSPSSWPACRPVARGDATAVRGRGPCSRQGAGRAGGQRVRHPGRHAGLALCKRLQQVRSQPGRC